MGEPLSCVVLAVDGRWAILLLCGGGWINWPCCGEQGVGWGCTHVCEVHVLTTEAAMSDSGWQVGHCVVLWVWVGGWVGRCCVLVGGGLGG